MDKNIRRLLREIDDAFSDKDEDKFDDAMFSLYHEIKYLCHATNSEEEQESREPMRQPRVKKLKKKAKAHPLTTQSTLTPDQVREIVRLVESDAYTRRSIAAMYGVGSQVITDIVHGRIFSDITGFEFVPRQKRGPYRTGSKS